MWQKNRDAGCAVPDVVSSRDLLSYQYKSRCFLFWAYTLRRIARRRLDLMEGVWWPRNQHDADEGFRRA